MNEPKPLPSETKLVETPRVNAAVIYRCAAHSPVVHADLARQLERELSSAQTGIAVLNGIIRVRTAALASLADELRLARTELKGCYRLIDELKEELRLAREEQIALLRFIQKEHPVTREMWSALFPSST